jgi:anti-anti-sigma factor
MVRPCRSDRGPPVPDQVGSRVVVDATRILCVAGEIDIATAPQLAEALEAYNGSPVCVDLTGVTFMDSSGIAVLL